MLNYTITDTLDRREGRYVTRGAPHGITPGIEPSNTRAGDVDTNCTGIHLCHIVNRNFVGESCC